MRITVLQPDPNAPLDRFATWLDAAGAACAVVELWAEAVPALEAVGAGLIVLGGHGNALDAEFYPWLPAVKALLRDAVTAGRPILGICLGHQILADALGGEVGIGDARGPEDGAVRVMWPPAAHADPVLAGVAALGPALVPEAHHDVVTRLPAGATELAASALYPNQAFRLGSALGVQFHPEASPELMAAWAVLDGANPDAMHAAMRAVDAEVAAVGERLAAGFAAQCATRASLG